MHPIGVIRTPHDTKENCPIQPKFADGALGSVVVDEAHEEGLKDIESFTHLHLLYHLDRAGEIKYLRQTFMDNTPHGIYASRHPCRPNSIGMSIVKLVSREGNVLTVEGVDMLDKTPLLDIKPYMPKFDMKEDASGGWTDGIDFKKKPPGRE